MDYAAQRECGVADDPTAIITHYLSIQLIIFAAAIPFVFSGFTWYLYTLFLDVALLLVVILSYIFVHANINTLKRLLITCATINVTVDSIALLLALLSLFECAFQGRTTHEHMLLFGENLCLPVYILSAFAETYIVGTLLFSILWLLSLTQSYNVFWSSSLLIVCFILTFYTCTLMLYTASYVVMAAEAVALVLLLSMFLIPSRHRPGVSGAVIVLKTASILFLMLEVLHLGDGVDDLFESKFARWIVFAANVTVIAFVISVVAVDVGAMRKAQEAKDKKGHDNGQQQKGNGSSSNASDDEEDGDQGLITSQARYTSRRRHVYTPV